MNDPLPGAADSQPPATDLQQAAGRPRQLSLRPLLLLTLIVGLGLGYFDLSRRFAAQQYELDQLRQEAGYLAVGDPSKVHVRALPTLYDGSWKWKIHLPSEGKWLVKFAMSDIRQEGYSEPALTLRGVGGDFTLDAFTTRKFDGTAQFSLAGGGASTCIQITDGQLRERFCTVLLQADKTGNPWMEVLDPAEHIELLRYRANEASITPGASPASPMADKPAPGVLIWLEREP